MQSLFVEAKAKITPEKWKRAEVFVIENVEKEFWNKDGVTEEIEDFIIELDDSDEDDDEDEDGDDGDKDGDDDGDEDGDDDGDASGSDDNMDCDEGEVVCAACKSHNPPTNEQFTNCSLDSL